MIKNITAIRIPNHWTLNKFQHQRPVRAYHWSNCFMHPVNCKVGINSSTKCML